MPMRMFVKPAEGLVVLGPDGKRLPDDGATVERSAFWLRRIASGDVAVVDEKAE